MTRFQKAVAGLNPRQVAYCRLRFEGKAMLDAYAEAGYSTSMSRNAQMVETSRMEKRPKIARAIANLQEMANKRSEITREDLCEHLLSHRELAVEDGQIGAANQAVMGVAKIMGLEINRSEVSVTHTYEVEQATQELFNMLNRRGRLPEVIDVDAE